MDGEGWTLGALWKWRALLACAALVMIQGCGDDLVRVDHRAPVSHCVDYAQVLRIADFVEVPDSGGRIARFGDRALLTGENGLHVMDLSVPGEPARVGEINLGVRTHFVAYSSDRAVASTFVSSIYNSSGLQVLDMSSGSAPVVGGSLNLEEWCRGLAVADSFAYVATTERLQVVDLSDPAAPRIVATLGLWDSINSIAVADGHVYLAERGDGLVIVDVTMPTSPTVVGSVRLPYSPVSVTVKNGRAYLGLDDDRLLVVDVSTPAAAAIEGSVERQTDGRHAAVSGKYLYMSGPWGLDVIDVGDPAAPALVGSVSTHLGPGSGVVIQDGYALCPAPGGILVIDVLYRSSPGPIAEFDVRAYGSVAVFGDLALVASWENANSRGLWIFDVADPASPRLTGIHPMETNITAIAAGRRYAYVAVEDAGILVIDLQSPAAPVEVGQLQIRSDVDKLELTGSHLFIVDKPGYAYVADIADPARPQLIEPPIGNAVRGMDVSDDLVYLATFRTLKVMDVSDPGAPIVLHEIDLPRIRDVVVTNRHAIVRTSSSLHVIRFPKWNSPREVAVLEIPGGFGFYDGQMEAAGDFVYASGTLGISVVDVSAPASPEVRGVIAGPAVRGFALHRDALIVASPASSHWAREDLVIVARQCGG